MKLSVFLRRKGISLARVRSLKYLPDGLTVNGAPARSNRQLQPGDVVALNLPPEAASVRPEDGPLALVHEDADALVVNKPPGQVMHPSPSHHTGTLANLYCGLMARRGAPGAFRPVGRLDGDTSGLVLCAKHAAAAPQLFRSMRKGYLALAGGLLPVGTEAVIAAPLMGCEDSAIRQQVHPAGKPSRTRYQVLAAGGAASLVAVWPETGRTHQIRVHFAHIGHPLLGDALYGGQAQHLSRHALHCAFLQFTPLDARPVAVSAPPPPDMLQAAVAAGIPRPALAAAIGDIKAVFTS